MSSVAGPVLLVGAGKMGRALLEGWLKDGVDPRNISIRDPALSSEVSALMRKHGIEPRSGRERGGRPSVIVLAVKPQLVGEVLPTIAPLMDKRTVLLSIAAGRTFASLAQGLPKHAAIVRAMPNTPAAVGHGMTVACANDAVSRSQRKDCDALLEAVGEVIWIDDESLLDAVTAISGSGPAYVFLLAESLADAGVKLGLEPKLAARLARATVYGAGELLRRSDASAAELRENVTSPKGTTAAALKVLMGRGGFKQLLARAAKAAAKRSRELSS
jgi:pyrroline-5-carboxylate reductase